MNKYNGIGRIVSFAMDFDPPKQGT